MPLNHTFPDCDLWASVFPLLTVKPAFYKHKGIWVPSGARDFQLVDLTFDLKDGLLCGVSPVLPLTSHARVGETLTFPEP